MLSSSCRKLQHFHLQGAFVGSGATLQPLPSLKSLNFSHCGGISDDILGQLPLFCPNLTELVLVGCYGITDASLEVVLQSLPKLQHLCGSGVSWSGDILPSDESGCDVASSGLQHLGSLAIRGSKSFTTTGFVTVLRRFPLPKDCMLHSLDVSGCLGWEDGCTELLSVAAPALTTVILCRTGVTTGSLPHLLHLRRLQYLDVSGCTSVHVLEGLNLLFPDKVSWHAALPQLQLFCVGGGKDRYCQAVVDDIGSVVAMCTHFRPNVRITVYDAGAAMHSSVKSACAQFGQWSSFGYDDSLDT
jgi:hypothetical protein